MAGNRPSLVNRSRVEGFVDIDCVGEDGVIEAHVHKIVHSVAATVTRRGAIRAISDLAAGALQSSCFISGILCTATWRKMKTLFFNNLAVHLLEGPRKLPLSEGVGTVTICREH